MDEIKYDKRHGGPWDRGSADNHYVRIFTPHYYVGNTHDSELVTKDKMTEKEIAAYFAGWEYNELFGDKKSYDE